MRYPNMVVYEPQEISPIQKIWASYGYYCMILKFYLSILIDNHSLLNLVYLISFSFKHFSRSNHTGSEISKDTIIIKFKYLYIKVVLAFVVKF